MDRSKKYAWLPTTKWSLMLNWLPCGSRDNDDVNDDNMMIS